MTLLILDSSREPIARENAETLKQYGDLVQHVVFPETEQVGVKLSKGLALVRTTFASFCADDDLVFPQGLADAVQFLCGHPDYACAHGLYLNYRIDEEYPEDVDLWREYGGPGNEAEHPGARIFRLFQKYESLFYAVFRATDLRDVFGAVQQLPSLHYQELFQSAATLIKGKVCRFPALYAARQSCDPAQPERDKWQTFYWFADDPKEVLEHYTAYRDVLWRFYEAHGMGHPMSREDFFRAMDLAHAVYFVTSCPQDYLYSTLQKYWPGDPYTYPANTDLFFQLAGTATGSTDAPPGPVRRWSPRWMLLAARYVLQAVKSKPYLMRINWLVARACRTAWKCKLRWSVRWMVRSPAFRRAYFEMCQYLDGPYPPAPLPGDGKAKV